MITPPTGGEDCRTLWRKVAECAAAINALKNMRCIVEGEQIKMIGNLESGTGGSVLVIRDNKETTN